MGLLEFFRRKSTSEETAFKGIKSAKKAKHNGIPTDECIGGKWISREFGCYRIAYKKRGRLMTLYNLEKVAAFETNPKELNLLLEKVIKNSKDTGCEMIVIKTWIFAKYPELKKFGFKELKEGSEKKILEKINKKKIDVAKLLETEDKSWYPAYYLKLK